MAWFYGVIGLLSTACFLPVVWTAAWMDRPRFHRTPVEGVIEYALVAGAGFASLALAAALHARLATFGPQLILDRGCGPLAAIRGCWRLSRGHFFGLWGFHLLLWAINLAGLLLCYVGVLLTLPLTHLAAATAYLDAVGRPGDLAPGTVVVAAGPQRDPVGNADPAAVWQRPATASTRPR